MNAFMAYDRAREPLYSNSAVIAWWLKATSAQKRYLAVKKGIYFGQFFTSENIHRELLSLINPAVHPLDIICGLGGSLYSARVMPKM